MLELFLAFAPPEPAMKKREENYYIVGKAQPASIERSVANVVEEILARTAATYRPAPFSVEEALSASLGARAFAATAATPVTVFGRMAQSPIGEDSAALTYTMEHEAEPDRSVWRGVFAPVHERRVLFAQEHEVKTAELPRRKPSVMIGRRLLERDDD
ncbi:MAG: hypothetical protein ACR2GW_15335 [Pyrinomonadaceae bacterium]